MSFKTLEEFYGSEPQKEYAKRIKRGNHMVFRSLREHAMEGKEAGGFVNSVLRDSLSDAFGKADRNMEYCMKDIVLYLCNPYPGLSWRSKERVIKWREEGGLVGKYGESEALKIAERKKL